MEVEKDEEGEKKEKEEEGEEEEEEEKEAHRFPVEVQPIGRFHDRNKEAMKGQIKDKTFIMESCT